MSLKRDRTFVLPLQIHSVGGVNQLGHIGQSIFGRAFLGTGDNLSTLAQIGADQHDPTIFGRTDDSTLQGINQTTVDAEREILKGAKGRHGMSFHVLGKTSLYESDSIVKSVFKLENFMLAPPGKHDS